MLNNKISRVGNTHFQVNEGLAYAICAKEPSGARVTKTFDKFPSGFAIYKTVKEFDCLLSETSSQIICRFTDRSFHSYFTLF